MTKNPISLAVESMSKSVFSNRNTLRDPTADPRRRYKNKGRKFVDLAESFFESFPFGVTLTKDEFDEWAFIMGHLEQCESGSSAWEKHLTDRNKLRKRINLGGASRHLDERRRFQVEVLSHQTKGGDGTYIVRPTYTSYRVSAEGMARDLSRWFGGQLEELERLQQSTDATLLGDVERFHIDQLIEHIQDMDEEIAVKMKQHSRRLDAIKKLVRLKVESVPEGTPTNGGFTALNMLPSGSDFL